MRTISSIKCKPNIRTKSFENLNQKHLFHCALKMKRMFVNILQMLKEFPFLYKHIFKFNYNSVSSKDIAFFYFVKRWKVIHKKGRKREKNVMHINFYGNLFLLYLKNLKIFRLSRIHRYFFYQLVFIKE